MTDVLVFQPEASEENSKNLTDPQRPDGDLLESDSVQVLEIRGTENSSPEGWMSGREQEKEPEERERWKDVEDKRNDDDEGGLIKEEDDGSLADDEDDGDDDDLIQVTWMSEKARQAFTPNVMIVKPTGHQEDLNENPVMKEEMEIEKVPLHPQNFHASQSERFHPQWIDEIDKPRDSVCGETVRLCVFVSAAAVMFPLLTWGGYKLLPFNPPPLDGAPLRLIYTLRCAFFASIPIVLGVLVQGVSRLKYGTVSPLFDGTWKNREVSVHSHYVRDSLHLYLLYFLQLAIMATYAQQEVLKLVPVLTIIFVFGRLIYWACAVFGSSGRALGFGLSFLPLLPLLGANIYFICSAEGQEVVFDVATPTTAPPPKQRRWG
ncbi:transmembrane protein 79 [Triplophysa dalaica]|uniref:transmembrane protein 79 n=1 Tax=Triplophysa dalaica TaxID=1582913 RepID=UPI0024E017B5|nr:transmembrane protein 79 [Triplophysa dalaica]